MNRRRADLARLGILNRVDQGTELIAHSLGSDASGGRLEIDVGCAADASIEGVALRHEGVGGHGAEER